MAFYDVPSADVFVEEVVLFMKDTVRCLSPPWRSVLDVAVGGEGGLVGTLQVVQWKLALVSEAGARSGR